MSKELKPCPWCLTEPWIIKETCENDKNINAMYKIMCGKRGCEVDVSVIGRTKEEAIKAWNTRRAK